MRILKKIKLSRIIILIVLLSVNTLAWFIYVNKIDSSVSVHVNGWDVLFKNGEDLLSEIVNINVENVYPGMSNYQYDIDAYNRSEVPASLSYKILEMRVLNDTYVTREGRAERGESPLATDLTSDELISTFSNYPFTMALGVANPSMNANNGTSLFSLTITWPYENNNDTEDTRWGILASNFKKSNPTLSSITLRIKLTITQTN